MATTVLKNTFLSNYKDDFRDSDNYHRIIFNSGRALQARELTQLQTIINKEIERLGRYLFKESSIISGNLGTAQLKDFSVFFAKLDTSTNALPTNYASLENTYATNPLGIKLSILKVIPATGSDPATILYSIVDANDQSRNSDTKTFISLGAGQDLSTDLGTLTIQTTNTVANPALGRASMINVPSTEVFQSGHFVFVPKQSLVLSKYSNAPDDTLVYKVSEEIVTVSDDLALYDNAGSTPNLTSPGADRYRIRLTLDLLSNINEETDTFIKLIRIRNGDIEALQYSDNILNQLGDTLARRTDDITGSFIADEKNKFNLEVLSDSSDDHLRYVIKPGVAFVNGYRIEKSNNTTIRVPKPRGTNDKRTVTTENVAANYGNYFPVTSSNLKGLVSKVGDYSTVNLYDSTDLTGTLLGTARIRSIDKVNSSNFRVHVFDINVDSNGSGTLRDIGTAKSIGSNAANLANIDLIENRSQLIDPDQTSMLFRLPSKFAKELTGSVSLTVGDVLTTTTNGAGEAVFQTNASDEDFADEAEWILSYDSAGEITTSLTIDSGGAGTTEVKISGLTASKNVSLLAYVNTTGTSIPKTNDTHSESISVVNRVATLSKTDVHKITSVIDDTTNENITYKFTLNTKTNSSYYGADTLKLITGYTPPAGTVTVSYSYYLHGSGDFYSVNSYNGIDYSTIPDFTIQNTSRKENLANVIDFRSSINSNGTFNKRLRIPRNRDIVSISEVDYYTGRIDLLAMNENGGIERVATQAGEAFVKAPKIPAGYLGLNYVFLNPYTKTKNDYTRLDIVNKGYKMTDIRNLEKRIDNLEVISTLTLSELNTTNLTVVDENGLERISIGLFADNFKTHKMSLVTPNLDYKAALKRSEGILLPRALKRDISLFYDSDMSNGTKRYGALIYPKFDEEVLIDQAVASSPSFVNGQQLARFNGTLEMIPDHDNYYIRRTVNNGSVSEVAVNGDLSDYDNSTKY